MSDDDREESSGKLKGLLKKAVTLGTGVYVTAEDTVNKTLSTVQVPKEMINAAIENFFETYTLQITAEIKLKPKKEKS